MNRSYRYTYDNLFQGCVGKNKNIVCAIPQVATAISARLSRCTSTIETGDYFI